MYWDIYLLSCFFFVCFHLHYVFPMNFCIFLNLFVCQPIYLFPEFANVSFSVSLCLSLYLPSSEHDQVNAYCIWQQHRLISRQLFICQMPNLRWQLDKQEKSKIGKAARKEKEKKKSQVGKRKKEGEKFVERIQVYVLFGMHNKYSGCVDACWHFISFSR